MSYYAYLPNIRTYLFLLRRAKYDRNIRFAVEGGLGDIIAATQFVNYFKDKWPDCHVCVYYRDENDVANPEDFSHGTTRKYQTLSGRLANPNFEWIDAFYNVDEIVGYDLDKVKIMSIHPNRVGAYRGYLSVKRVKKMYFDHVFDSRKDSDKASELLDLVKLEKSSFGKKIVTIHLRRNAAHIVNFAVFLQSKFSNLFFIFLGSTEHQNIPNIPENLSGISLIDSYNLLGIDTIEVLKISSECDLFIGGRGGFEMFHYFNTSPSINFFDDHGRVEICALQWPSFLFRGNIFGSPYSVSEPFIKILKKITSTGIFDD